MWLVFAEVAEVLAQADGRDKSLDNLVVLRLLVAAAALLVQAALAAELDLPSSRSNNRHY